LLKTQALAQTLDVVPAITRNIKWNCPFVGLARSYRRTATGLPWRRWPVRVNFEITVTWQSLVFCARMVFYAKAAVKAVCHANGICCGLRATGGVSCNR